METNPKQKLKESSDNQLVKMNFPEIDLARQLFGDHNHNLQKVAGALDVSSNVRGNTVFIKGDSVVADLAQNILNQLYGLFEDDYPLHTNDVDYAIKALSADDRIQASISKGLPARTVFPLMV